MASVEQPCPRIGDGEQPKTIGNMARAIQPSIWNVAISGKGATLADVSSQVSALGSAIFSENMCHSRFAHG